MKKNLFVFCAAPLLGVSFLLLIAHGYGRETLGFFDLDKEGSLKAVFSGFQLGASGFLSLLIVLIGTRIGASRFFTMIWSATSALFFYLALDDMMALHERVGFVVNNWLNLHGAYESFNWLLYFSPLMLLGALVLFLAALSLFSLDTRTRLPAVIGFSGFIITLIMEFFGERLLLMHQFSLYHLSIIFEEISLLVGETFFLTALVVGCMSFFSMGYMKREDVVWRDHILAPIVSWRSPAILVFFLHWLGVVVAFTGAILVLSLGFSSFIPLLSYGERLFALTLPYEAVIRFFVVWGYMALLAGSLVWVVSKGEVRHRVVWLVQALCLLLLLPVVLGDWSHRLMEEFSFIRYTTSGFLFVAAFCALIQASGVWREGLRILSGAWLFLACGFMFGALDELFQIHEFLGSLVERASNLSHGVTDLITVGYAITAGILLSVFFVLFRRHYGRQQFPFGIFFVGGIAYFISTMFDTLDGIALDQLKQLALTPSSQFVVNDMATLLLFPRNFFNSLEEVLEYVSASLFFTAIALLILEKSSSPIFERISAGMPSKKWVLSGVGVFCVLSFLGMSMGAVMVVRGGDISDASATRRVLGPREGLKHSDDLFYHPLWGLIIGNEGGNSVVQWKDGITRSLTDPLQGISDPDSITADNSYVYASSGAGGLIARYAEGKGWETLWTQKDGLSNPEALVVVDGSIYVLDEGNKTITKLEKGKQSIEWKPDDPAWRSPEGIAYDAKRQRFIVTDDESGAVFEVLFGISVKKIAQLRHAEDVTITPEDTYLISDNGSGMIIELSPQGEQIRVIRFARAYRDLQGIAVEGSHIYVVTADGYGQGSVMPSYVVEVER